MFIFAAILFPVVLLGGVLAMERIERQFAEQTVGERVMTALGTADADDVERLVATSAQAALDRHWRRDARRAMLASEYPSGHG